MAEFEPKQFGKYFLLEKLAVGGMAEIYKAKTFGVDGFEKLVVIKRILPHCAADKDFITMLVDEAKLSVALSHANIVQTYDLGKVGDDYFISMEFISGINLRDVMYRCRERNVQLPTDVAAYIASEVCKGLDYAHRKTDHKGNPLNIVHRDISPQNILISYEGEVKIADFGIAKAAMNISHTMAGILKGKIAYMSPEQALGKSVDHRTDIFSSGIILHEALTGEKLFTGESQFEVLKKIRSTRIDSSKIPESVPETLREILSKSLAYYSKDRYQNAGDMQIDLTRFLYTSYVDFTPQKIAAFIRELFSEEISSQLERGVLEATLEAQTSSINVSEQALQENIVHREDTSPTVQTESPGTDQSLSTTSRELMRGAKPKQSIGRRLASLATMLVLFGGLGFAYWKFAHPQFFGDKVNTNAEITGTASVASEPPDAMIYLDNKNTGLTTPAILENLALNEDYTIKLSKEGFEDVEHSFRVSSDKPVDVNINLAVLAGTLEIETEPEGATVFLDNKQTGFNTPTTLKNLTLETDQKIILKKEGYRDFEQSISITNSKPQKLIAKLVPLPEYGKIEVVSEPSGADIFLDGRNTGEKTPTVLADIRIGETHSIRITKHGHLGFVQSITLNDDKTETITAKLAIDESMIPVTTTASISSSPSGVKIYLNEGNTGLSTPATVKSLEIGKTYTFLLKKDGYQIFSKTIKIADAKGLEIYAAMSKVEPPPPPPPKPKPPIIERPVAEKPAARQPVITRPEAEPSGEPEKILETEIAPPEQDLPASLRVNSRPSGAEVFINNVYRGNTPIVISKIPPGTVNVLISKEGKAGHSESITLSPGENKDMGVLKLGQLYGTVSIESSPAGADVAFDGQKISATTPLTIRKVRRDRAHTITLDRKGYQSWERTFEMNDKKDMKFNVILERY